MTSTSLAFFQDLVPSIQPGTFSSSTSTFATLIASVKAYADGFVSVHAKFTPSNGGLSEQFDRNTGSPISAADLTWSYAAALTGFNARSNAAKTKSWGAKGLSVPSTCVGNAGPTVQVTFDVQATTFFGGE